MDISRRVRDKHYIKRVTVDINTDSRVKAVELQNSFSRLCRGKLKRKLDETFTKILKDNNIEHLRIDRLEVDLGKYKRGLDQAKLLRDFPKIITKAITNEIAQQVKTNPDITIKNTTNTKRFLAKRNEIEYEKNNRLNQPQLEEGVSLVHRPSGEVISKLLRGDGKSNSEIDKNVRPSGIAESHDHSDETLFWYYLDTGLLPWWANENTAQVLSDIYLKLDHRDAGILLSRILKRPELMSRICYQWSIPFQLELLEGMNELGAGQVVLRLILQSCSAVSDHYEFIRTAWHTILSNHYRLLDEALLSQLVIEGWQQIPGFERWRAQLSYSAEVRQDVLFWHFLEKSKITPVNIDCVVPESLFLSPTLPQSTSNQQLELIDNILVDNAGLALFLPYLSDLFKQLSFINKDGLFVNESAQQRAVHTLQYMVVGELDYAEPELVLNKILCGISPEQPVWHKVELSTQETNICDEFMTRLIALICNDDGMSLADFKCVYIQRRGSISIRSQAWLLRVEAEGRDVLIQANIPEFKPIHPPWSPYPLVVEWGYDFN